jgi:hypothetical protein
LIDYGEKISSTGGMRFLYYLYSNWDYGLSLFCRFPRHGGAWKLSPFIP